MQLAKEFRTTVDSKVIHNRVPVGTARPNLVFDFGAR